MRNWDFEKKNSPVLSAQLFESFFGTSDDADQMQERLNHLPVVITEKLGGCCDTQSGAILLPHSGGRQRVRP